LKVLIISDYAYPVGGIEVFIDEIVLATKESIDYRILTWSPFEETEKRTETAPTIRVICGDYSQIWNELDWADLLFYQASWNIRLFASIIRDYCNLTHKALVSVIHTSSNSNNDRSCSLFQRELLKDIIKVSNTVVGVSGDVIDSLLSLDESSKVKYLKIENASRFYFCSDIEKGKKVVSFIGRPTKAKGIDIFVELIFRLKDTDLDFNVNTVSIPLPDNFKKSLENLGKSVKYQFLLSDEEMLDFYKSTDLLIVPYRHSDGLPLTILEALSCGIPIIGLDASGVSDILLRHNQIVLKFSDVNELANIVRKWHEGKINLKIPNIKNVANWDEQAMKYIDIFERVLK